MAMLQDGHGLRFPRTSARQIVKNRSSSPPANPVNKDIRSYCWESSRNLIAAEEGWLQKPDLPTTSEILGNDDPSQNVFLAPNKISGPWPSKQDYLRTQYNLIREDAIAPLRDAVAIVRDSPHMDDTGRISIYQKVYISGLTMADQGIAFRLRFSTKRAKKKILWEYSNRLTPGTLVALSPVEDLFKEKCVVAVVADRPLENITKNPPEVDIYFADPDEIVFNPQQCWIMVESLVGYYEAHRHTMTALQKLSNERFPLCEHIVHLDPNIGVPEYVTRNPEMNFRSLQEAPARHARVNVLEEFPQAPMGNLNEFQWKALEKTLTEVLPIIQGPPGTGKSYVSVIALKILLSTIMPGQPPIIVATHTNHALDQLISLVAKFEKNFVRLGGRSSDIDICQRTLFELRKDRMPPRQEDSLLDPARRELKSLSRQIVELLEPFQLERLGEPLPVEAFVQHGLLTEEQLETLEDGVSGWVDTEDTGIGNPLTDWLGDQGRPFKVDYTSEAVECAENEIDMEYEQLMELEAEQGLGTDEAVLRGTYISLDSSYRGIRSSASSIREAVLQEFIKAPDLFKIPVTSRGAVYNYLRALLHDRVQCKLREAARQYKTFTEQLLIGKWERDEQILRDARLIGMTTTGLSKYRGLVSSLKPRIVLIEEAAEVIEAPAAVACFESVQQLILVGDHQQLKGHCALHDLEGAPFYLDMSMFERLVRNHFPYTMLREQRRMAPEICELLTPIYGVLVNHASVQKYPLIPGMGKIRSWFFNHHWPESGDSLSSKTNEMEAIVVSELYAYLLMNGVNTRGITVLTLYNGQRKLLLKNMKSNPYLRNHYPNVMTIDSYQGEENDVVLLSLVRSNDRGNLGFVGVENRACVALSRAKHGFFIFGNADCLVAGSKLWTKVVSCMSSNNRLAAVLPLTCQNHNRQTLITGPQDWAKHNGGCSAPCEEKLHCGHPCTIRCHTFDHSWIICTKMCPHVRPCCGLRCDQNCSIPHRHYCPCAPVEEEDPDRELATVLEAYEQLNIDPRRQRPIMSRQSSSRGSHSRFRGHVDRNRSPYLTGIVRERQERTKRIEEWQAYSRDQGAGIDAVPQEMAAADTATAPRDVALREIYTPLAPEGINTGAGTPESMLPVNTGADLLIEGLGNTDLSEDISSAETPQPEVEYPAVPTNQTLLDLLD